MSNTRLAAVMPIGHIATSLVIGWLWLRTESIWIVALAHGALNSWGQHARDSERADPAVVLVAGSLALLAVGSLLIVVALPSGSPFRDPSQSSRGAA